MVAAIEGVVKLVPVPSKLPPVEVAYQLIVPAEAVASKVTVPVPHLEFGVVLVIVGKGTTVTVTCLLRVVIPDVVASIK